MNTNMEKTIDFKLIDGEFNQKDAKEVLVQLINDKINFHVRRNFSSKIRFGYADENSEKRITALNADLKNIISFFQQEEKIGQTFSIQAKIEVICHEEEKPGIDI